MSAPRRYARRLALVGAIGAILLATASSDARPGGGGGFSGGSKSGGSSGSKSGGGGGGGFKSSGTSGGGTYSSGGSGGCSDVGGFAVLLVLVFVVVVVQRASRASMTSWDAGAAPVAPIAPTPTRRNVRRSLEALQARDPNFSLVLLEDFLYALYAELHVARGAGQVARLSAYLDPSVVGVLSRAPAGPVQSVIVGAMRFVDVAGAAGEQPEVVITVEFEANYTEGPVGLYVRERWILSRAQGVQSRTPDRARVLGCPGCGAPLDAVIAGQCGYCKQLVSTGRFDWLVRRVDLLERETRGPILTSDVAEVGTDLPTVVDPAASARFAALTARDPSFHWQAFEARIGLVFREFQAAWAARDLLRMRPFMSDGLFQTQTFWVETYLRQRLRNVTENAHILRIDLARVGSDRFFDAITVRVFAASLDYTIADDGGRIVSGSRSRERTYSEYWTFIRGSARTGPTRTDAACPSCGAALRINMAGHCEYCRAKVTSGEFDWVLSRIEQDDVYEG